MVRLNTSKWLTGSFPASRQRSPTLNSYLYRVLFALACHTHKWKSHCKHHTRPVIYSETADIPPILPGRQCLIVSPLGWRNCRIVINASLIITAHIKTLYRILYSLYVVGLRACVRFAWSGRDRRGVYVYTYTLNINKLLSK